MPRAPRSTVLAAWLAPAILSPPALAASGLPPAPLPGAATTLAGATLFLELVVNRQPSGQVVPVRVQDGSYLIAADTLRSLHVRTPAPGTEWVAVDRIAGVAVRYDGVAQRLELDLPPEWLPAQQLGRSAPVARMEPLAGRGFLLNYDLFASNPGRSRASTALWTEQRWFGPWGLLSNTGVLRRGGAGAAERPGEQGYLRYDTQWRLADPDAVRQWTAGDLITATLPWGSAVRIGGLQIARNFSIRPDLVSYPLPSFSGQAAVPSAVDLFINGQRAGSEVVQPGPFTLNTMPFITGAGEAAVVTTDALGRRVLTTVPFYVASTLLKAGTTDYALSAGALRRRYGQDSFGYGRPVASASYRLGWSDRLTLEARAELARGLALGGAGAVLALGHFGVANAALAHGGSGQQWTLGYQYNAQRFGLALQHTRHGSGWRDLASLDRRTGIDGATDGGRRHTQATLSWSLGAAGAVAAGYFDARTLDGRRSRLLTASYSLAVGRHSFLTLNLNRALGSRDHLAQLQWTLLLDGRSSVTAVAGHDRSGLNRQLQYSRTPPTDGGMGWNLAYADGPGTGRYSQGSLTWRGDTVQLQGGAYAQGGDTATWAGAAGSLVAMDGGWFAANRIYDAFALVSTGVPDVPVMFENQPIGRTDARGHLLVPGVNAWYPARFEIDTLQLPAEMQADSAEKRVLLGAGSGALLQFRIQQLRAASITLVDEDGRPLPVGLSVEHLGSGRRAPLGWDGQVYLEELGEDNELLVRNAGAARCSARFALPKAASGIARVGPLVCQPAGRTPPSGEAAR